VHLQLRQLHPHGLLLAQLLAQQHALERRLRPHSAQPCHDHRQRHHRRHHRHGDHHHHNHGGDDVDDHCDSCAHDDHHGGSDDNCADDDDRNHCDNGAADSGADLSARIANPVAHPGVLEHANVLVPMLERHRLCALPAVVFHRRHGVARSVRQHHPVHERWRHDVADRHHRADQLADLPGRTDPGRQLHGLRRVCSVHLFVRQLDDDGAVHDVVLEQVNGVDRVLQHDGDHHYHRQHYHCTDVGPKRAAALTVLPGANHHAVDHRPLRADVDVRVPVLQRDALRKLHDEVQLSMECHVRLYPTGADRLELDHVDHCDHHNCGRTNNHSDDNNNSGGWIDCFDCFDCVDCAIVNLCRTNKRCDVERSCHDERRHSEWSNDCDRWYRGLHHRDWRRGNEFDSHRRHERLGQRIG